MMAKRKAQGSGVLFGSEAKSTFLRLTGSRYDALIVRLKKKGLPIPYSKKQFREHLLKAMNGQYDGFVQCRYCRGFFGVKDLAADHEIPLSREGGSAELWNIGFPCQNCNMAKGSLKPNEFLSLLAFLEKEIPLGRQDVLGRLAKAVSLAQGARSNAAVIGTLKASGQWQEAQKQRRLAKKAQ